METNGRHIYTDLPDIKIDTAIRSKYHAGFPRTTQPDTLVIHASAGPNPVVWVRDAAKYKNPRESLYYKGIALFNYDIEMHTGEIIEVIDPSNYVHANNAGRAEERCISIEMEHLTNTDVPFHDIQYKSLFKLFNVLMSVFNIKRIASHNFIKKAYTGKTKVCPGPGFDWLKVSDYLDSRSMKYVKVEEAFLNIEARQAVV